MIGYLKGQLLQKKPNLVVVDVHGVGYEVQIPLTSFYELPAEGNEVALKIHTTCEKTRSRCSAFIPNARKISSSS